jgi:hypothetical protein
MSPSHSRKEAGSISEYRPPKLNRWLRTQYVRNLEQIPNWLPAT